MLRIALSFPNELLSKGVYSTIQEAAPNAYISTLPDGIGTKEISLYSAQLDVLILQPTNKAQLLTIREVNPKIKLLIIDEKPNPDRINELLQAKPEGFLLNCCPISELKKAVHNIVLENLPFFCDSIIQQKNAPAIETPQLTKTEIDILNLLKQGCTTKIIAEQTYRSQHTINTHRKNILKKLSCKNTAEMLHIATEKNLIS